MKGCDCCSHIRVDSKPRNYGPAAAIWRHDNGNTSYLCRSCLDHWFDNADDDPDLEPAAWSWLPGHRPAEVPAHV